jgi:hypothetical protein
MRECLYHKVTRLEQEDAFYKSTYSLCPRSFSLAQSQ